MRYDNSLVYDIAEELEKIAESDPAIARDPNFKMAQKKSESAPELQGPVLNEEPALQGPVLDDGKPDIKPDIKPDAGRAEMYSATGDPAYAPQTGNTVTPSHAANSMKAGDAVKSMQNAIIELVDLLETVAIQKSHALGVLMSDQGKKYIEEMRNLGRTEGRGDPNKADGFWQDKTNRSLGYAAQVASVILQLATQYKINTGKFNYGELQSFSVQIPKDWKTADKVKLAPIMEKYIREILDMVNAFNADPNANTVAGTTSGTNDGYGNGSGQASQQGQNQGQGSLTNSITSQLGGLPISDPLYLDRIEQFFELVGGPGGWIVKNNQEMVNYLSKAYGIQPGQDTSAIQRKFGEIGQLYQSAKQRLDQIRGTWVQRTTINSQDVEMSGSNPATIFMQRIMRPGMQDVDGRNCAIMINEVLGLVMQLLQDIDPQKELVTDQQAAADKWTQRFNKVAQLLY